MLKTGWTVCAAAFLLAGCSFGGDSLWPSLTGDEPSESAERIPVPPSPAEQNADPTLRPLSPGATPQPLASVAGLALDHFRAVFDDLTKELLVFAGQLIGDFG